MVQKKYPRKGDQVRVTFELAANGGQRVDIPERADEKGVLGLAEVVLLHVAKHEVAAPQAALDRLHGSDEPRIVSGQKPDFVHAQQAGVERIAVHRADEAAHRRVRGPGESAAA